MTDRRLLQVLGYVVLGLLTLYSFSSFASSQQQFQEQSQQLTRCQSQAQLIEQLRNQPDQAAVASHSERALARAIEQSSSQVQIASEQIASIEPQTPRRLADSDYLEYSTVVHLEQIALPQLPKLANQLRQFDASLGQLHLTTLRLDAPYRETEGEERWNAEFTLTYYVYSPKNSPSRSD